MYRIMEKIKTTAIRMLAAIRSRKLVSTLGAGAEVEVEFAGIVTVEVEL